MAFNDLITIVKGDNYSIFVNQQKNRVYLTLVGYWQSPSDFTDYLDAINCVLGKVTKDFTILVDMTRYSGSAYELNDIHIRAQKLSIEAGVKRIAEVIPANPLIKMLSEVYSKKSGALPMTFNDIHHAERWLDLY